MVSDPEPSATLSVEITVPVHMNRVPVGMLVVARVADAGEMVVGGRSG